MRCSGYQVAIQWLIHCVIHEVIRRVIKPPGGCSLINQLFSRALSSLILLHKQAGGDRHFNHAYYFPLNVTVRGDQVIMWAI